MSSKFRKRGGSSPLLCFLFLVSTIMSAVEALGGKCYKSQVQEHERNILNFFLVFLELCCRTYWYSTRELKWENPDSFFFY